MKEPKLKCPRCYIEMIRLYERSFGDISQIYGCPKCRGVVKK